MRRGTQRASGTGDVNWGEAECLASSRAEPVPEGPRTATAATAERAHGQDPIRRPSGFATLVRKRQARHMSTGNHRSGQRGGRFSMNASIPSAASGSSMLDAIDSLVVAYAPSSGWSICR